MSTAVAPLPPSASPFLPRPAVEPGRCVLIENVDWQAYEAIGEAFRDRANIRLTYDRGRLEIMTLSAEHERLKILIGYLIQVLAEETALRICSFGSTTYKRDILERGLEPDQCFYYRNLARVRGLRRIDLSRDPPPDLAVEVDVTNSSLNRMSIYAHLGVSELWRLEGETLRVYGLGTAAAYEPADGSSAFPAVPVSELVQFLRLGIDEDDTTMIQACRAWVREHLAKS